MKTTIDLWHKVWPDPGAFVRASAQDLERLVELARADEREHGQKWFDAVTAQHKQLLLAEREACAKTRAGKPRELKPVGSGAFLDEQQFCFDKGWHEGAASVRAAIKARGQA
jgi:hypothetical protein